MHDDINTKRTELANQMAAAGAANLDFTGTAAVLAAIPDTEPQQYVAAGTAENIAAILPATISPARRMRHGERPTEALVFDEPAATSGDAPTDLSGAHHLAPDNIAAVIRDLRTIEDGTTEFPVEHRDWRTEAGVLARIIEHLVARIESAAAPATASGDELPPLSDAEYQSILGPVLSREGMRRYRNADPLNLDPSDLRAMIDRARAAVSAATKPTADLSRLTRYSACGVDHMEIDEEGMYALLADVQSLLATKPAAAPAVAEGWKLVPVEPTLEMIGATGYGERATFANSAACRDYKAMLAAAPAASTTGAAQTGKITDQQRVDFLIANPSWSMRWRIHTKKQVEQWQMRDDGEAWGQWGDFRAVLDAAIRVKRPTPTHSSEAGDVE